ARAAGRRRAWALRGPWRVPDAGQRGACAPRWWIGKDSQALSLGERLHAILPQSTLQVIADSTAMIRMEQPRAVAEAITKFIPHGALSAVG
ncbi:MAG: pimeloyl-ACP methyl ester carboxylesterase, partial [Myxococcota bacterium]